MEGFYAAEDKKAPGTVVNADRQFKADVTVEGTKITGVFNPSDKIHT